MLVSSFVLFKTKSELMLRFLAVGFHHFPIY